VRVLVASTGGAGHFNPVVPFVEALVRRGDQVLIVVPPELRATVEAMGRPFRVGAAPPRQEWDAIWDRVPTVSPQEMAVLVNRELFGRLCTAAMLPAIEKAFADWRPDLLLREPCEYASAIVADRRGIPHAQVAVSQAEIESDSLDLVAPVLEPYRGGIVERISAAPYLTRFPAALDPSPFADTRRFAEAQADRRRPLPEWWEGSDAPLVYVTFGSVAGGLPVGAAAFRAALAAVDGLRARVLLTVGRATDVASLGRVPANVHIEAWVSQDDVLATAALVVCHGGSGTTFGALAAGVPLVMVPLFADQPANARAVARAGAGLVVMPGAGGQDKMGALEPEDVPRIRAAIESVLGNESIRAAASHIAAEMRAFPTIDTLLATLAADLRDGE
jgi:UDP:flavonoid glycosyltransferase YjiC (YdhE family)